MSRARSLSCSPRGSRVAANRRSGLSEDGACTEGGRQHRDAEYLEPRGSLPAGGATEPAPRDLSLIHI
eukprot:1319130-Pyramimonas_sp.AAC.1